MRRISVLLAVVIILAIPVLANIDQKAALNGENNVESKVHVDQVAWSYGRGNISQDIGITITGNDQILDQDGTVLILDPDYADDISNTIKGNNLIKIDLTQYGKNTGSGNINQGIKILVENNMQMLDQHNKVFISDSDYTGHINNTIRGLNLINIGSSQRGENTGSGNITQEIDSIVSGNNQILSQDNKVHIDPSYPEFEGNVNSTIDGSNLINNKFKQYGKNSGSLDIAQKIGNLIKESLQELGQMVSMIIQPEPAGEPEPVVTSTPVPDEGDV